MQRLIPSETALVLGGGGAKGAYEIGVIEALEDLGIRAGSVFGVSIGALNAAMYAQERIGDARDLWDSLTVSDIVSEEDVALAEEAETMFDRADKLLEFITRNAHHKGLDTTPMEQILGRFVSEDALRASTIRFGLVTTRFPSLSMVQKHLEDMEPGSVHDWLMASAACYPAFPMRAVGNERYIDGGFCDNTPVDMAVRAGARHVIAVDIGKHPSHTQYAARPNITYIRATHPLGGLLTFDPKRSRRNRALGYNDAMRAFGKLRGTLYAFDPIDALSLGARAQDFIVRLTQFEAGLRLQNVFDRKGSAPLFALLEEELRPGADAIDYFLRACELCAAALEVEPAQVLTFEALRGELRARLPLEKAESMLDSLLGGRIGVLFAQPQPDRRLILACLYHLLQRESTFSALALHTLSAFPRELLCALTLREVL